MFSDRTKNRLHGVLGDSRRDAATIGSAIPITQIRALGDKLRHEYRDIDRAVIFDIARVELPGLAVEVELILGSSNG